MRRTHILAGGHVVEVNTPLDDEVTQRAARYTTLAFAARLAKGGLVSNVPGWVEATHTRACAAEASGLDAQMAKWAAFTRDRFEMLPPICDLLLRRSRRTAGGLVDCSEEVPEEVEDAAVTLFGHSVFSADCSRSCRICAAAREGEWARALRFASGRATEAAAAALADGYRSARGGGHVPLVAPYGQKSEMDYLAGSDDDEIF